MTICDALAEYVAAVPITLDIAVSVLAFIGAPLLVVSDLGVWFNLWGQTSTVTALAALPVAIFEFSLGVYLIVKGFRPSPILSSDR